MIMIFFCYATLIHTYMYTPNANGKKLSNSMRYIKFSNDLKALQEKEEHFK